MYFAYGGFGLLVVVLLVICWNKSRLMLRRHAAFQDSFPPISDGEYLARCRPGTDPDVALRVRRVLSDCLNVDYQQVYPSARLGKDLGAE